LKAARHCAFGALGSGRTAHFSAVASGRPSNKTEASGTRQIPAIRQRNNHG